MAGRRVCGGAPAGPGRPERRVPELLRLGHGRAERAEDRAAPVPVPQGPPAGDPVHRQRPVQDPARTGNCACRRSGTCRSAGRATLPSDPSAVTVIRDAAGRYFARFVVEAERDAAARRPSRCRHRPRASTTSRSCPTARKISSPRFLRRAETKLRRGAAGPVPQGRRAAATGTRPGSRSPGRTPGWPTRGGTFTTSCPRRSSATTKRCRGGPGGERARPDPAGQVGPRRRLVGVRAACWSTRPSCTAGRSQDRPVRADPPGLLGLRRQGRPEAAARPRLAVPAAARCTTGISTRRQRRQGRRTGGDSLWSAGKTGARPGARVKQEPSEVPHDAARRNLPPPGGRGSQFIRLSKTGDPNAAISYGRGNGGPTLDQRAVVDGGFAEMVRLGELPIHRSRRQGLADCA